MSDQALVWDTRRPGFYISDQYRLVRERHPEHNRYPLWVLYDYTNGADERVRLASFGGGLGRHNGMKWMPKP